MLLMTREDVITYINQVIKLIAENLKITDYESEDTDNLKNSIKTINPDVNAKLDTFINHYKEWHNFHVSRCDDNTAGIPLNSEETKILLNLIEERDKARIELIIAIQNKKEIAKELNKNTKIETQMDDGIKKASQKNRENRLKHPEGFY